jgi:hypothetical protein
VQRQNKGLWLVFLTSCQMGPACVKRRWSCDNDAMHVIADAGAEADVRSATEAACGSGGLVAAGRCEACRHSRDSGRHH